MNAPGVYQSKVEKQITHITFALFDITYFILILNMCSLFWTEVKQYQIRANVKQKTCFCCTRNIVKFVLHNIFNVFKYIFKILNLQLSSNSPNLSGGLWGKSNLAAQLTYLPTNRSSVSHWNATVVLWSPQQPPHILMHTHTHSHMFLLLRGNLWQTEALCSLLDMFLQKFIWR